MMKEEPLKHLLPIMFKLGPKAISRHYRAIARHYTLAGEAKQATISSLSAFLWWPSPRATIHCARALDSCKQMSAHLRTRIESSCLTG